MSRACASWMDEIFERDPVPSLQVAAASSTPLPSPPQPQQPQVRPKKQPLPPNLFEEVFLCTRRSLHQVFPSLVAAPFLDALMANGLPAEDSDADSGEDEANSSLRPASSKGESSTEQGSSTPGSGLAVEAHVTTLTIHGLPRKFDLTSLQEAFAAAGFVFGEAIDYALIPKRGISHEDGTVRRYAFVNFTSAELAIAAKAAWHGKEVKFPNHIGDCCVLRVGTSKVQGLDNNLKINAKDAWVSTASTASKMQRESKAGNDDGEGAQLRKAGGGTKKLKEKKRNHRSQNASQWQG